MMNELDLCSEFSDTSYSFFFSSLKIRASESEAEDSKEESAEAVCKISDSQRRKTRKAKTRGKSKLASK